jgi:tetratricopeptide (TPR) repeat protein
MSTNSIFTDLEKKLSGVTKSVIELITEENKIHLLGEPLSRYVGNSSGKKLIQLTIFADGMRTVYDALFADGSADNDELDLCYPFLAIVANMFAKTKSSYKPFTNLNRGDCPAFLAQYAADSTILGYKDLETNYYSLGCCSRAELLAPSGNFRARLVNLLITAAEALLKVGGMSSGEHRYFLKLKNTILLQGEKAGELPFRNDQNIRFKIGTPSDAAKERFQNNLLSLGKLWRDRIKLPDIEDATLQFVIESDVFGGSYMVLFSDLPETTKNVNYDYVCVIASKNNVRIPIVCVCLEYRAKDGPHYIGTFDSCGHTTWKSIENVAEITRFTEIATELAMVLSSPCRTADQIIDAASRAYDGCESIEQASQSFGVRIEAAGNIHEVFEARYEAYELALRAFDNPEGPGWNDEIIKQIRESGSLTESEIFLGKTSFTQAVLNRVVTHWVSHGLLGKVTESWRPGSEINTTGDVVGFDYTDDDFLPRVNGAVNSKQFLSRFLICKACVAIDEERFEAAVANCEAAAMADWDGSDPAHTELWALRAKAMGQLEKSEALEAIELYNLAHDQLKQNDYASSFNSFLGSYLADSSFLWAVNNAAWVASNYCKDLQLHDEWSNDYFAIQLARIACIGSAWRSVNFIDTLAESFVVAGAIDTAIHCFELALAIAPNESRGKILERLSELKTISGFQS